MQLYRTGAADPMHCHFGLCKSSNQSILPNAVQHNWCRLTDATLQLFCNALKVVLALFVAICKSTKKESSGIELGDKKVAVPTATSVTAILVDWLCPGALWRWQTKTSLIPMEVNFSSPWVPPPTWTGSTPSSARSLENLYTIF